MNIDLAALRALEREREIPFDTILAAIETALLTAYRHTEGAESHARVEIDRRTGAALVYAQELLPGRVGLVGGLFFGFAFGMGGLGAAILGEVADHTSIEFVYQVCAFLPAVGLLAAFLPRLEAPKAA